MVGKNVKRASTQNKLIFLKALVLSRNPSVTFLQLLVLWKTTDPLKWGSVKSVVNN